MKILILSTVPFGKNGISTVIRNLYLNSCFENEQVTFAFSDVSDEEYVRDVINFGHTVELYSGRNSHPIRYYRRLKKMIRDGKYDIVHVHGNSGTCAVEMLAAKRADAAVRIIHSHSVDCVYKTINKLLNPLMNRWATDRFSCSEAAGRYLFGEREFTVIKNSIRIDDYCENSELRRSLREQYSLENKTVLGHVGTFSAVKNQAFLIDVLKEYKKNSKDAVLVLVGDGEMRPAVEKKVADAELSGSVIFLGARSDICAILNMFDYFVFPSLSEGFGIAPIEAQANGLPVIASKDRIVEEVRINPNFIFLPLEDGAEAWSKAIMEMPRKRCEDAAKRVCDAGFDLSLEITRLKNLYAEMLSRTNNKMEK